MFTADGWGRGLWTHAMGKMMFVIAALDTSLPGNVTAMLRIKKLSSQSSLIFCNVEAIWLNWLVIDSSIPNSLYTSWSCASIRPVTTFRWGLKQWQWPININSKCDAKTKKEENWNITRGQDKKNYLQMWHLFPEQVLSHQEPSRGFWERYWTGIIFPRLPFLLVC